LSGIEEREGVNVSEEYLSDDSSHYEISLTGGQAFTAFVLLLGSLAAAFGFGLLLGRGAVDERLVVKRDMPVIQEGSSAGAASEAKIVELGTPARAASRIDIVEETTVSPAIMEQETQAAPPPVAAPASEAVRAAAAAPVQAAPAPAVEAGPAAVVVESVPAPPVREAEPRAYPPGPVYAQLLSSSEAKTAETLAARLIDAGFTSAWVERGLAGSGDPIFRVRVKFDSETEARESMERLKSISRTEPWLIRR
jgi:hypothetical protein